MAAIFDKRHLAEDCHTVVHLLPVDDDVRITKTFERIHGKLRVLRLGFLQAQNVRRHFLQEPGDNIHPEANRIDVPGSNLHAMALSIAPQPRKRQDRPVCIDPETERPSLRGHGARVNRAFVTLASFGNKHSIEQQGGISKPVSVTACPLINCFPVANMNGRFSVRANSGEDRAI